MTNDLNDHDDQIIQHLGECVSILRGKTRFNLGEMYCGMRGNVVTLHREKDSGATANEWKNEKR